MKLILALLASANFAQAADISDYFGTYSIEKIDVTYTDCNGNVSHHPGRTEINGSKIVNFGQCRGTTPWITYSPLYCNTTSSILDIEMLPNETGCHARECYEYKTESGDGFSYIVNHWAPNTPSNRIESYHVEFKKLAGNKTYEFKHILHFDGTCFPGPKDETWEYSIRTYRSYP